MSNRELAAKIVHHMTGDLQRAHYVAEELADAGLIAPDTDHPAALTTEADFASAPVGTVVTRGWRAAIKRGEDEWSVTGDDMRGRNDTVGDIDEEDPYTVLRWGPGKVEK